jgi:hypothetical protein
MNREIHCNRIITFFFILMLMIICRDTVQGQKTDGLLFDGLSLIGQSTQQVDEMLGKAVESERHQITQEALKQPGRHIFDEIRHYKIEGKKFINYTRYGAVVRFLQGKAISFDVDLPKPQKTPQAALALVGIDVTGKTELSMRSSERATFWRDDFSGKQLTVAATIYDFQDGKLYNLVEVRLVQ